MVFGNPVVLKNGIPHQYNGMAIAIAGNTCTQRSAYSFLVKNGYSLQQKEANKYGKSTLKTAMPVCFSKMKIMTFSPVVVQNNVLIVQAIRTKGSSPAMRYGGIDLTSGDRIWQIIPQASRSLAANASSIIDLTGVYDIHLNSNKLILMQAFDDPADFNIRPN